MIETLDFAPSYSAPHPVTGNPRCSAIPCTARPVNGRAGSTTARYGCLYRALQHLQAPKDGLRSLKRATPAPRSRYHQLTPEKHMHPSSTTSSQTANVNTPPLETPPVNTAPVDKDLAEQARPGHGIPSQDTDPAAQVLLDPKEAQRESQSALAAGGVLAGAATGAAIGVAVAGPVGVLVGASVGAVAGALGSAAAGATVKTEP